MSVASVLRLRAEGGDSATQAPDTSRDERTAAGAAAASDRVRQAPLHLRPSPGDEGTQRARRFALLVDSLEDNAISLLDPRGFIETWSEGARRIQGHAGDDVVGAHVSTLYTPEDVQAGECERELAAAALQGRHVHECWQVRKDGSRFWAGVTLSAMRDERGALIGFGRAGRDLTGRRVAEQGAQPFQLLVESVREYAIFILDPQGHVRTWNSGAQHIKGYSDAEVIGRHFSLFYPEEDVRAGKCELELGVAAREGRFDEEGWRVRKDGSRLWASVTITALRDPQGVLVGFAKVTRDLTDRLRIEEALRLAAAERAAGAERARALEAQERFTALLRSVADRIPSMLAYWDADQVCRFANAAYERWFGVKPEAIIGGTMAALLGPLYAPNLPYIRGALRGEPQSFEREIPDPKGGPPRHSQAHYLPDMADGVVRGFVVLVSDITQRRELELHLQEARERAEVKALHDALTGLPNRVLLEDRIGRAIDGAKRNQRHCGVLFLDLDGFKTVNDTLGHAAGDAVLIETTRRLAGRLRASDTLARLGGDEFVVLLSEVGAPDHLGTVAGHLLAAIAGHPFVVEGHAVALSLSIGGAAYPEDGADTATLLARADEALYRAKGAGKNRFVPSGERVSSSALRGPRSNGSA